MPWEQNLGFQAYSRTLSLKNRPLNKIKLELEEIGINAGNWVDLAQDRDYWRALVNAALNLQVP